MRRQRNIAFCLFVVLSALLLIGVASGTPVRHLIQVSVGASVLIFLVRGFSWARCAALPLFLFWLCIVVLIWLFLLGASTVASGTYAAAEIALTVVIGAASICGTLFVLRSGGCRWPARIGLSLLFLLLQLGAMWLSFRPDWANR